MPFWRTYYHLVWATKDREPLITPQIEQRLHAYIVHKAGELDVLVYAINGRSDHVHLVVSVPPHVSVSQLVKQLKGSSPHDLNHQGLDRHFAWQRGYGVLTLGQRQKADAEAYVRQQKEHHGHATAVAWLEYCAEVDEGPPDAIQAGALGPVPRIHEAQAPYGAHGEPAF